MKYDPEIFIWGKREEEPMRETTKYEYVRVSSAEQNEDRQLSALRRAGVPDCNIFADRQSGKDFHRAGYEGLISVVGRGDPRQSGRAMGNGKRYSAILSAAIIRLPEYLFSAFCSEGNLSWKRICFLTKAIFIIRISRILSGPCAGRNGFVRSPGFFI